MSELSDASLGCFGRFAVVVELHGVRGGASQVPGKASIRAFGGLRAMRHLQLEQEQRGWEALEAYGQGLDFADALHLLRSEGCAALVSLDRAFAAKAGELALTPAVRQL